MDLRRNQAGMTLLEIMIVLAILGGLATLVVTQVIGQFDKAKVKQAQILIGNMKNALDMYYTDCGNYPESLMGLITQPDSCSNWGPVPYIKHKKAPKDPWNHEFIYELEGADYVLISLGKDGRDGGKGLDADISSADM